MANISFDIENRKIDLLDFFHMSGAVMIMLGTICSYKGQVFFACLGLIMGSIFCMVREKNG